LARPGGNLTGVVFIGPEYGKRLELLREVTPTLSQVALLYNDKNPASVLAVAETQLWAKPLGVRLTPFGIPSHLLVSRAYR
jgi:putative ABC transport system substrate-binding protein